MAVDIRGCGASFGTWQGLFTEAETRDAYDITEWLAAQPWCDGQIGMFGGSYPGITQYMAAGTQQPHLRAIVPQMALFDLYDCLYAGGIYHHDLMHKWGDIVKSLDRSSPATKRGGESSNPRDVMNALPVDGEQRASLLDEALLDHGANRDIVTMMKPLSFRARPDAHNLSEEIVSGREEMLCEAIAGALSRGSCALIGVTQVQATRHFSPFVMGALRPVCGEQPVLFGGPDCFPHQHGKAYFDLPSAPDILLQGEAEIALPEFLKGFEKTGTVATDVPGFVFPARGSNLTDNGPAVVPALKRFPFSADYSIFTRDGSSPYRPVLSTFTSRGCVNRCAFCNEWSNFKPYRRRKIEDVVSEVEKNAGIIASLAPGKRRKIFGVLPWKKRKVVGTRPNDKRITLGFVESNINTSARNLEKFCTVLEKKQLNLTWNAMGCFRVELSTGQFAGMVRSGCRNIMWGLESASQRTIDVMGKNFDIDKARSQIARARAAGIESRLPILNGFPGEFTPDFLTTAAFILKYRDENDILFTYSNACETKAKSYLYDYPDDFLLENRLPSDFELRDGMNNRPLRELRMCLSMLLIRSSRRIHQFDAVGELKRKVDFNDFAVAVELARLIHMLGMLNGDGKGATNFLREELPAGEGASSDFSCQVESFTTDRCGPDADRTAFLEHVIPGVPLRAWFNSDKNEPDRKDSIIRRLDDQFSLLSKKITSEGRIDFKRFRESLYSLDRYEERRETPPGYVLDAVRPSLCDRGRFVIFEGRAIDKRNSSTFSRLEARAGSSFFDVHYGIDHATAGKDVPDSTGFWGKVKAVDLQETGLILRAIARDGVVFVFDAGVLPP